MTVKRILNEKALIQFGLSLFTALLINCLTISIALAQASVEKAETSQQAKSKEADQDRAKIIVTKPNEKVTPPETGRIWGAYSVQSALEVGYRFVDTNGTRGGQQTLSAALFFVPRATWPTKAEDTGVMIAEFRGYKVTNLSAPVWTELYIDGGWLFLVVGMGLLGFILRRADDAAVARFRLFAAPGVLAGTLPFYLIIMLRGSLLQSMAGFTVLIVCAAVVGRRVPASRLPAELTSR